MKTLFCLVVVLFTLFSIALACNEARYCRLPSGCGSNDYPGIHFRCRIICSGLKSAKYDMICPTANWKTTVETKYCLARPGRLGSGGLVINPLPTPTTTTPISNGVIISKLGDALKKVKKPATEEEATQMTINTKKNNNNNGGAAAANAAWVKETKRAIIQACKSAGCVLRKRK